MERSRIESSFLRAIGYSPESQTLEVEFKSGRIYQYMGVAPETYRALMAAESVGNFYSCMISSKYEHRRAHELEPETKQPETSEDAAGQ